MIRGLLILSFTFSVAFTSAQNFMGQWKGYFVDQASTASSFGNSRCDYVLDLEVSGKNVSGYSYTYFTDGGKKYYTICTLTGIADRQKKYIEVTETARTKTNVPDNISNSFQVHKLSWRKEGENEIIEGTWKPAPGQGKNGGFGTTKLAKRQLTEISALAKRMNGKKDPASKPFSTTKQPQTSLAANQKPASKPVAKNSTKAFVKTPAKPLHKDTAEKYTLVTEKPIPAEKVLFPNFEKRTNAILQTVNVENKTVRIELYDNGEVDGDSISLFYNGKVLAAHKRLCQKAMTIELPVTEEVNELVMYADNLGTLPPNTALMIVYDGFKRYEVRITSDLQKSGTIRFIHKSTAAK